MNDDRYQASDSRRPASITASTASVARSANSKNAVPRGRGNATCTADQFSRPPWQRQVGPTQTGGGFAAEDRCPPTPRIEIDQQHQRRLRQCAANNVLAPPRPPMTATPESRHRACRFNASASSRTSSPSCSGHHSALGPRRYGSRPGRRRGFGSSQHAGIGVRRGSASRPQSAAWSGTTAAAADRLSAHRMAAAEMNNANPRRLRRLGQLVAQPQMVSIASTRPHRVAARQPGA